MATKKELVLQRLEQLFPQRIIYKEQYTMRNLGSCHMEVYKLAKGEGQGSKQWLQENGFIWKETGYVEPDMLAIGEEIRSDNAVSLADSIMRRFPLIGQYVPTAHEVDLLYTYAQNVVSKMSRENTSLTKAEELVLTVSTVELLKDWSSDLHDDDGNSGFWYYIYLQYGFNPENAQTAEQRVYHQFCAAIKNTLLQYKRYFAPDKTMRYYTSLLLHALAPVQSIESLFDILFDFYVENLEFQYVSEDPVYNTLVKGMQARWKNGAESEQKFKLRSAVVMSGLKTLFTERPGYMAFVCDNLVKKMDILIRGEEFSPTDRWDELLQIWYRKKSSAERGHLQSQKRERRAEFIATTSDKIYMQYLIERGKVGIVVPQIRLSEIGESRPSLVIYQGAREVYRSFLSLAGNQRSISKTDLSLTTRRCFVPFESTDIDFGEDLRICGEIEYMQNTLYSSGSKLYRDFISFDAIGNERSVKSGIAYLFAGDNKEFVFSDDEGVFQEDHNGQLIRVNLSCVDSITLSGIEIFADEKQTGKVRLYPSARPIKGVSVKSEGMDHAVFTGAFDIRLLVPEDENVLKYQVYLDGQRVCTSEDEAERGLVFAIDESISGCHTIRIVDIQHSITVLEYRYIILPGFSFSMDKPIYLETENEALISIHTQNSATELLAVRIPDTYLAAARSPYTGFDYEFEIPTLSCRYSEHSAFELPHHMWHKCIGKEQFLTLDVPSGVQVEVVLGTEALALIGDNCCELGNYLQSGKIFGEREVLWLNLKLSDGHRKRIFLSEILFCPTFVEEPITYEEGQLFCQPEEKFYGDKGAKFDIELGGENGISFSADLSYQTVPVNGRLKSGCHACRVYLKSAGLFSKDSRKLLRESEIVIGNRNEFRFENTEIVLTNAIYWDFAADELKQMGMKPSAGILEKLEYVGDSIPSGESVALPEYDASLFFLTTDGRRIYFNFDEHKPGYEWINPVRVWIVNERRLILRTVTDDAVYFDTLYGSIVNRDPDETMSKTAQRRRLQNPDYFEYKQRGK